MKKITSILLCFCLMLSMALSVSAEEAVKPVYVALGDDISAVSGLETPGFTEIIASTKNYELVNLAQNGNTAADILAQVTSGELDADIAKAELITITCGYNDMMNLIFGKIAAAYNEQYDPDIAVDEIFGILEEGTSNPVFMKLVMAALPVLRGNEQEGEPSFLESDEFRAAITAFMGTLDQIMAAIAELNPDADVILTTQYNPYRGFGGLYASLANAIDTGLQQMNRPILRSGYRVANLYTAFDDSAEVLVNATSDPMNLDFTPNAAGHAVIADCIIAKIPHNPFTDVAEDQYYFDPVLWAVENKITAGTKPDQFSPDADCTRAQVVTFLWRAFGSPDPTSTENPFTDVAEGEYYYNAVLWAVENKITAGTKADKFSPDEPCTRAQVVTFLWRTFGWDEPEQQENPFTDVAQGEYYYNPVLWAVENKITAGTKADKFSPDQTCTRAQIVTFLYRAFN